ncbi:MAG: hypothetical protein KatS3mg104_3101 [Phycisphaerae bacterium]|nr:MAG: hypothetical protein KatS3mg104_3101 [Phycisphaerae bacterium]
MRFPKLIWLILVAGLLARLGWGLSRPTDDVSLKNLPDQVEYLEIARNILSGQGMRFYDPVLEQEVYAYRMPGYPVFIAACGANVRVVRGVQAVLDTTLVLGVLFLLTKCAESVSGSVHHLLETGSGSSVGGFEPLSHFFQLNDSQRNTVHRASGMGDGSDFAESDRALHDRRGVVDRVGLCPSKCDRFAGPFGAGCGMSAQPTGSDAVKKVFVRSGDHRFDGIESVSVGFEKPSSSGRGSMGVHDHEYGDYAL